MRRLDEHLAQAEKAKHSCLVCRHFHYTDHGTVVVCGKRISVTPVLVDGWTAANYRTSCTRAARCEFFDDMRGARMEFVEAPQTCTNCAHGTSDIDDPDCQCAGSGPERDCWESRTEGVRGEA